MLKKNIFFSLVLLFVTISCQDSNIDAITDSDNKKDETFYFVSNKGGKVQLTRDHIGERENLNILEIAEISFLESSNYNAVIFKVSDVVGSTKKANSKIIAEKQDWKLYDMKKNAHLYYYYEKNLKTD
jgi:hypothetical protein